MRFSTRSIWVTTGAMGRRVWPMEMGLIRMGNFQSACWIYRHENLKVKRQASEGVWVPPIKKPTVQAR